MVKIQAFFGVSTEEELSEKIDEREVDDSLSCHN